MTICYNKLCKYNCPYSFGRCNRYNEESINNCYEWIMYQALSVHLREVHMIHLDNELTTANRDVPYKPVQMKEAR